MFKHLTDTIGMTPLVRIPFDLPCQIYAKLEYMNPGYSVKDRTALYMIEEAERTGLLKKGGTIIEASSGNQGIAAAMIGAAKGYRVIITVTEKISKEKLMALRAYGAEVVICKSTTFFTEPENYHAVACKIHEDTPGSFMLNQYFNQQNQRAHYATTGPELWRQSEGKITHLIAAIGSGGTISGAGKFLKEQKKEIKIIGVDTPCSYAATKGHPRPYSIEGMGIDYDTPFFDRSIIDEVLYCRDEEAKKMIHTLPKKYGFLVGPASAAVAHSAYEFAKTAGKENIILIIFTDSGRAYLERYFSE